MKRRTLALILAAALTVTSVEGTADRNQRRIHFLQILLSRKVKSHQKKLELRMKKHRKKRPQTMKSVFLMKLMTVRMKKK